MKNNILFSIIIPMFNCEKTINKTIKSVLNQTYENFELILIDDGSKDETLKTISKYCNDSRITVIKKENEGVSSTRNKGLDIANGDYIMFLDADDYYDHNLLMTLFDLLSNNKIDLLKFGYYKETKNGLLKRKYHFCTITNKIIEKREFNKLVFPNIFASYDFNPVWNCAISKKCIKNIRFDSNLITAEDLDFVTSVISNVNNIYILDIPLIHYIHSQQSITRSSNLEKSLKKFECQIISYNKIKEKYNKFFDDIHVNKRIYSDFCSLLYEFIVKADSYNDYKNMLEKYKIVELYAELIKNIDISLNMNIKDNIIFSENYFRRIKQKSKMNKFKNKILNRL